MWQQLTDKFQTDTMTHNVTWGSRAAAIEAELKQELEALKANKLLANNPEVADGTEGWRLSHVDIVPARLCPHTHLDDVDS